MKVLRRSFLKAGAAAAAAQALPRGARADLYPSRPVTMIVPFPPGGPTDTPGRVIAERMSASLGQPVIVENVGGAEGSIGTGRVARANPDGYTIVLGVTNTHVMNGAFYKLPYDVLHDFAPISPLFTAPLVLYARNTLPAENLRELIAWLKANREKATAGFGTATFQVVNVFFEREIGTQLTLVPYHGSAPGIQDLIAGQIDLYFTTPVELALVRAGSIKAYAVTSDTRLPQAPDIPTFAEMGLPTLSFSNWYGLFAPKGTSADIIGKLDAAAVAALADPNAQARLVDLGYQVFPRERQTPEALGAMQKADAEKWWPIIKEAGIGAQ
jgi:tripartite-type tricarboxylate transporter receptor subunit TctC